MLAVALAFELVDPLGGPVAGVGEQAVAVVLMGASRAEVRVGDVGPIVMADPGYGYLAATARMAPRREVAVRLSAGGVIVFDAMVPLVDTERDVLAFDLVTEGGRTVAVRAPYAPMAASSVQVDPRVPTIVHFAWGALVGAGIVAAAWLRRGR